MKLEAHLRSRREAGHKLLVPYVTGGLGTRWLDVLRAVAAAGADAIEIGIPFSDPIMDGATIQEASQRALDLGATPASVIAEAANADVGIPLAVMTYYNLVYRMGHERCAAALAQSGIAAAIVPDLPLDELDRASADGPSWGEATRAAGIENVLLASPLTPDDRLRAICARSEGFVYAVSLLGVTGERDRLPDSTRAVASRLKAVTDRPVLLGVGISNAQQAAEAAQTADGVVVGSALIRRLLAGGGPDEAGEFVAELRAALDGSGRTDADDASGESDGAEVPL